MLVDVVPMRHNGVKLPKDVVISTAALRGVLIIQVKGWRSPQTPNLPREKVAFAYLKDEAESGPLTPHVLPQLRQAVVTRIDGDSMIIAGLESRSIYPFTDEVSQAWWCRLVKEPSPP